MSFWRNGSKIFLKLNGINKSFGTNQILFNINFQLKEGQIHALLVTNVSGKSTLIKILGAFSEIKR